MANKGLILGGVGIAGLIAFLAFSKSASAAPAPGGGGGGGGWGGGGGGALPPAVDCTQLESALANVQGSLTQIKGQIVDVDAQLMAAAANGDDAQYQYLLSVKAGLVSARNAAQGQANQLSKQVADCKAAGAP